jgi:hypothetical protein
MREAAREYVEAWQAGKGVDMALKAPRSNAKKKR